MYLKLIIIYVFNLIYCVKINGLIIEKNITKILKI